MLVPLRPMPIVVLAALAVAASGVPGAVRAQPLPSLSFGERLACAQVLEEVYWERRLWPAGNVGAKPSLEEVLPAETLVRKAEDALRKSRALEDLWGVRIQADELQAEIARMATASRRPEVLVELWAALDNDPRRVAECLARPLLVDRLLGRFYARDRRFGGDGKPPFSIWWEEARLDFAPAIEEGAFDYRLPEPAAAAAGPAGGAGTDRWVPTPALPPSSNGTAVWTGSEMIFWGGGAFGAGRTQSGARYDPATDSWVTMSNLGAPTERFLHSAVWTGTEMIVWGGCGPFDFELCELGNGGRYDPVADAWSEVNNSGAPTARMQHTAVWTGSEMIVWGGCQPITSANCEERQSGGRYDPTTDSWMATSLLGAPAPRADHTAVWTGSEMIVWGGDGGVATLSSGGRYDPGTDTWSPTDADSAPTGRRFHTAVWTGNDMIVFGGCEATSCPIQGDPTQSGGRYDPATDSWTATPTAGAPSERASHTAVWSGSRMVVWGGETAVGTTATGSLYDPAADAWSATSTLNAPSARSGHRAVWTGDLMVVWGGSARTGGRYDPLADAWTPTNDSEPEVSRADHTAVWTGAEMVVWGGDEVPGDLFAGTGSVYEPATASWRSTTNAGAPSPRLFHSAVWTGTEMIVWGGQSGTSTFRNGGRYDPMADAWTPTSVSGAPISRATHTAVWTGTEMIVWGGSGQSNFNLNSGGRYDPATDTWAATTTVGAPAGRRLHGAVWTGSEMILWGGSTATGDTATGSRYDPAADAWTATSTAGAPGARNHVLAVWTGDEMIVWSGVEGFLFSGGTFPVDGGRYDPATDGWTPTPVLGVPVGRALHSAVWSGDEMIVWGGCTEHNCGGETATGGRFDPATDAWTETSVGAGTPSPRSSHTAVWTGEDMIAWGGLTDESRFTVTGAHYLPEGLPTLHVARIALLARAVGGGFRIRTVVEVADADGNPAGEVLVRMELIRPNGSSRDFEATTGVSGRAAATLSAAQPGTYTVCVTALEKEGFVHDPGADEETCEDITLE